MSNKNELPEPEVLFAEFLSGMPELIVDPSSSAKDTVNECFKGSDAEYIKESFNQFLMQTYY